MQSTPPPPPPGLPDSTAHPPMTDSTTDDDIRAARCPRFPLPVSHPITFHLLPFPTHASCPMLQPRPGGSTSLVSTVPMPRFCHAPLLLGTGCTNPKDPRGIRGTRDEGTRKESREPPTCDGVTPHSFSPITSSSILFSSAPPSLLFLVCYASPASPCPVAGFPPWFDPNLLFLKHLAPEIRFCPIQQNHSPPLAVLSATFCLPVSSASLGSVAHSEQ